MKSFAIHGSSSDWRKSAAEKIADSSTSELFKQVKDDKLRGVVISCLVFEEFCQELAGICLEQSASLWNIFDGFIVNVEKAHPLRHFMVPG